MAIRGVERGVPVASDGGASLVAGHPWMDRLAQAGIPAAVDRPVRAIDAGGCAVDGRAAGGESAAQRDRWRSRRGRGTRNPGRAPAAAPARRRPSSCSAKSPRTVEQHRLGRLEEARPVQLAGQLVGELAVGGRLRDGQVVRPRGLRRSPPPRARSGDSRRAGSAACAGCRRRASPRRRATRPASSAGTGRRWSRSPGWCAAAPPGRPPSAAGWAAPSHSATRPAIQLTSRAAWILGQRLIGSLGAGSSRWRWPGAASGPNRSARAERPGRRPASASG